MKKFALKSAVLAIGALAGASAFAAPVDLDSSSSTAAKYASEMSIGTSKLLNSEASGALAAGDADLRATAKVGATLGADVSAYVRIDLDATAKFTGSPTLSAANSYNCATGVATANAATATIAQSDANNKYVIFAVSPANGECLNKDQVLTFDLDSDDTTATNGITVTDQSTVSLTYRLFETLTAAANPISTNTLKTASRPFIQFASALALTPTAGSAVAAVGATPSYTAFKDGVNTTATVKVASLEATVGGVAKANGQVVAAGELLEDTNKVTLTGNFGFAVSDGSAGYDANAKKRVYLNSVDTCARGAADVNVVANATTLTAESAEFSPLSAAALTAATHYLCFTAEGTPEIAPGDYNAVADVVAKTGYSVTDSSAKWATITRDGVRMVAPLVQTTSGFLSRLVMTNTGSSARAYTVTAVSESGVSVVLSGAGASGSLAAGKTTIIDLAAVAAITGATRTSLVVTVNAPQSEIDGLYQIVNPVNGAISNHLLSYKN